MVLQLSPNASTGGGTGLIDAPSLFGAPEPANGEQIAFLQGQQHSFSQLITLPSSGQFDLSFAVAGRPRVSLTTFGDTAFDVFLGSDIIYSGTTATGQPFTPILQRFDANSGSYQFRIELNQATGKLDQTAFFDNIQIEPIAATSVPTPALLPGLVVFATNLLRKKHKSVEGAISAK